MSKPAVVPSKKESYPYGSRTLIGNWREEVALLEARTADYLHRLRNNDSLLAHNEEIFSYYCDDVQLEAPCTYLHYGAVVQLCAIDFHPSTARMRELGSPQLASPPMLLSLMLSAANMRRTRRLSALCDVSVAPASGTPCRRNSFVIRSPDGRQRTGEYLRYGEPFHLQLVEPDADGVPLVLFSSPKNMSLQNSGSPVLFVNGCGEITQAVGVCERQEVADERQLCLRTVPPLHCNWKALHLQPNQRYETEGEPVPSNERVVISHAATNRNLAFEDVWTNNYFGREAGCSVQTYQTVHRIETCQNIWAFRTAEKL